jgi:hypothetical protein
MLWQCERLKRTQHSVFVNGIDGSGHAGSLIFPQSRATKGFCRGEAGKILSENQTLIPSVFSSTVISPRPRSRPASSPSRPATREAAPRL